MNVDHALLLDMLLAAGMDEASFRASTLHQNADTVLARVQGRHDVAVQPNVVCPIDTVSRYRWSIDSAWLSVADGRMTASAFAGSGR